MNVRAVFVSDTHTKLDQIDLPGGDILFHCGDWTFRGDIREVMEFNHHLGLVRERYREIVVVAGNHDWLPQRDPALLTGILTNAIYLQDQAIEVCGLKVYGSPWQPEFMNWAFNVPRGQKLAEKWALIPGGLDVLITHGPPHGTLDRTKGYESVMCGKYTYEPPQYVGCDDLAERLKVVKPKVHAFGHVHASYGTVRGPAELGGILSINASICDEGYKPVNKPFVVDFADGEARLVTDGE